MVAAVNSAHNTYSSTGSYGASSGGYGGGPTGAAGGQEGMNISVLSAGHSAPPRSATNLITIHAQVVKFDRGGMKDKKSVGSGKILVKT